MMRLLTLTVPVHVRCYLSHTQSVGAGMLECGMLDRDRQTLKKCSAVLCKQLVVDEMLIQSLQANDILTENMAESIMVCDHLHVGYCYFT